ncbi:MAG: hypothetical protein ABI721_02410 [Candidatus Dojkabacteria bacterium]
MNRKLIAKNIEDFYLTNLNLLKPEKRFHLLSRLYLSTRNSKYKKLLNLYKSDLIPTNLEEFLKELLNNNYIDRHLLVEGKRSQYLQEYPEISKYNKVFFLNFFLKQIYGIKIARIINKDLNKIQVLAYFNKLILDPDALRILSSVAVNFLFQANRYLKLNKEKKLLNIIFRIVKNIDFNRMDDIEKKQLAYMVTHTIINISDMYSNLAINNPDMCEGLLLHLEEKMMPSIDSFTVDVLIELLVCWKLLDRKSKYEKILLEIVLNAYKSETHYLVESKYEITHAVMNDLNGSEHRNILFILLYKINGTRN